MTRVVLGAGTPRIRLYNDVESLTLGAGSERVALESDVERLTLGAGCRRITLYGGNMEMNIVDLTSMTWVGEATGLAVGLITTTTTLSGPQYPNDGYGRVRYRFTSRELQVTSSWSRAQDGPDHELATEFNGIQYLGRTYSVEYSVQVDEKTTIEFTTLDGVLATIPAWGYAAENGSLPDRGGG